MGVLLGHGVQIVTNFLHVIPNFALLARIAEQVCRVKCGHHFHAEVIMELAAHASDAYLGVEEVMQSGIAHDHYYLWPDVSDLAE